MAKPVDRPYNFEARDSKDCVMEESRKRYTTLDKAEKDACKLAKLLNVYKVQFWCDSDDNLDIVRTIIFDKGGNILRMY